MPKLNVDTNATATDMANAMFGSGVTVKRATFKGDPDASGIYTGGDATAPELTPADTGVILSTGNAADVTNASGDFNQVDDRSTDHDRDGDDDISDIAGAETYDAATLEAVFIPVGPILTMQFTFSSEEYLEYVGEGFNDAMAVYVNGVRAELSLGSGDITIDNINDETNSNLFIDNTEGVVNTEMDGLTLTLNLKAPVNPGVENDIRIVIADGGDGIYDSNLLFAADSLQTSLIANDDEFSVQIGTSRTVDLRANDTSTASPTLTITEINGQPVVAGSEVILGTGETILVNDDGTLTITGDDDLGSSVFTYTVQDGAGNTDSAFVTLTTTLSPPCFVAGTRIETGDGTIAVEDLQAGTLVQTRDNGLQPLRWVGKTVRRAEGKSAPIAFSAGAIGDHDAIELSPNHRVLVTSARAEMMFGQPEVLVKAKDLVNDSTIRPRVDGKQVTYVHLLFDEHEIVVGNGMESESYHPGVEGLDGFDPETRAEILDLMPELNPRTGEGYGPTVRTSLRGFEAKTLFAS